MADTGPRSDAGPWPASYAVPGDGATPLPLWEPAAGPVGRPPKGLSDQVRLALRLVVQLDFLGEPGPDRDARSETTQEGLAESLRVTQGAVSKVLARLLAVEVVLCERRHVRGRPRRVRIYFLSAQGRVLARQIEQRFDVPSPLHP